MKKILVLLLAVLITILCGCSGHSLRKKDIVGVWGCELYGSMLIIEFTEDNEFISHTDGSVNQYKIKGDNIITFVEGVPESEVSLDAVVKGDTLIYGGVEYVKK